VEEMTLTEHDHMIEQLSTKGCRGYFPPPPHDRSGVAAEQALMIALGSARIAPCSASPAHVLRRRSPIWQPAR
jgi:hypothetical protein